MLNGYVRASKRDGRQTLSPQADALFAAGVKPSRSCKDMALGHKDKRPDLNACQAALQPGNTLVLWKLGRLGRDLKHLVTTLDELRPCNSLTGHSYVISHNADNRRTS